MGRGIAQYDILLVDLGRQRSGTDSGSEMRRTRPCVVLSPDEMNGHLRTLVVAPMTTRERAYPTRVRARAGKKSGWMVLDQVSTIDRKRAIRHLGRLTRNEISRVKEVLRETYVD